MKKWITIILAVCLSVVLTACSLGKVETQTASEETVKDPNVLIVYYSDSDINHFRSYCQQDRRTHSGNPPSGSVPGGP